MKRTTFIFLGIIAIISCSKLNAQIPLTIGNGAIIPDYHTQLSAHLIMSEDDDFFTAYQSSFGYFKENEKQNIITYNKSRNSLYSESLTLPDGYRFIYAKEVGDSYLAYYYHLNKEAKTYEYASSLISKERASNGIKKVTPNVITTIQLGKKGEVIKYTAISPDKSKYAISLVVLDGKDKIDGFYSYVYDNSGNELWAEKFTPQLTGNSFVIHDMQLNNSGKVLFLLSTAKVEKAKQNTPTLQLFSFFKTDIVSMNLPTDFGYINSMKLLILKNENYFVGGFYNSKAKSQTTGYFNCIFNPRSEELISKMHSPFNDSYKEKNKFFGYTNQDYYVKCDYLYELDNDFIAMLGEQYLSIMYKDEKTGAISYQYITKSIFYNSFSLIGEKNGYEMINKFQQIFTNTVLGERMQGERRSIGNGMEFNINGDVNNDVFTFQSEGMSYCPIIKENAIYLIYNENIKNFNGKAKTYEAIDLTQKKDLCVLLTKIANLGNVENKIIMLPTKDKRIFNDIWTYDGRKVFFGSFGKKTYTIENFELDDQWSWD